MSKDVVPMHFTAVKSLVMSLTLMTTTLVLLEMRVVAVSPLIRLSTANGHPRRECVPGENAYPAPPYPLLLT